MLHEMLKDVKVEIDDLLVCTICYKTLQDPKSLPCMHTFCEACINRHATTSESVKQEKTQHQAEQGSAGSGFNCPICQHFVKIEETASASNWVDKLPNNDLISSMIDLKEKRGRKRLCTPCLVNDSVNKAPISWCTVCSEAYCEQCDSCHKKFRMSAKHEIIPIDELENYKPSETDTTFVKCDKHPDKTVDVYCVDHEEPCCTVCATIDHRKCDSIVAVQEAAVNAKQSTKTLDFMMTLQKYTEKIDASIKSYHDNKTSLQAQAKDISKEISNLKAVFIEHLDKVEKEANIELNALLGYTLNQIGLEEEDWLQIKSSLANWKQLMDVLIEHGSDVQVLVEVSKMISQKVKMDEQMRTKMPKIRSIQFKPSNAIKYYRESVPSIGTLAVNSWRAGLPRVNMRTGLIKVIHTLDIGDGTAGMSYGSGVFLANSIVLTHYASHRVLRYTHEGSLDDQLKLSCHPFDVARVDDTKVAVSTENRIIYVVDINQMAVTSVITSKEPILGIQTLYCEFIVAFNTSITWLDSSSGEKKESVTTKGDTYFIHASGRKDYIFADSKTAVSKVVNGKKTWTYRHEQLINPRGIDTDFEGNIYISCLSSKNIHQLSEDGQLIRIFNAKNIGIGAPWVIRFQESRNRFLFTDFNQPKVLICEIE